MVYSGGSTSSLNRQVRNARAGMSNEPVPRLCHEMQPRCDNMGAKRISCFGDGLRKGVKGSNFSLHKKNSGAKK